MLRFSVVIPVYNEEESIAPLYASLKNMMDKLGESYEIIFVNDGSNDRSNEVLNNIVNLKWSSLVIVELSRHYGQSITMQAGFDIARGEFIITMDGDLQEDPKDIPRLVEKLQSGYDVVCGFRNERKDPWNKVQISKIFSLMRRIVFKEKIHDPGCTFRIFKNEILKRIFLFKGAHRFFTLIVIRLGYKVGEMNITHHKRRFGKSKYNLHNRVLEALSVLVKIISIDFEVLIKRKHCYEIKNIIRT